MNNKITNPLLKQMISEIANKANEGRITSINWGVIEEAKKKKKKKKTIKTEADEPPTGGEDASTKQTPPAPENPPAKDAQVAGLGDVNPTEQGAEAGAGGDAAQTGGEQPPEADVGEEQPPADQGVEAGGEENPEQAQADAAQANAELEKAKAEKAHAEKEIEQNKLKLASPTGLKFLLSNILGDAMEKDTIDAFAAELSEKLKIKTPEDFQRFSAEMNPYKGIKGMAQLLPSLQAKATGTPETSNDTGES